jgi:hypothetical protein
MVEKSDKSWKGIVGQVLQRRKNKNKLKKSELNILTASWEDGLFCSAVPITHKTCVLISGVEESAVSNE